MTGLVHCQSFWGLGERDGLAFTGRGSRLDVQIARQSYENGYWMDSQMIAINTMMEVNGGGVVARAWMEIVAFIRF